MSNSDVVLPPHLTPSERLILMFLELHYQRHMKGATRAQIMTATGVGGRTFERCWKRLENENLIISERLFLLTQEGQRLAQQLASG